ncbi:MAG TPA: hypothetical protein VJQ84_01965 [Solirubrobacterales bacterium]|nr:hypothetical protein [Solirubrobacterales bacterium]
MIRVYLEVGEKRVFAMALDWPGWGRNAKDEERALAVLSAYAPRYEPIAKAAGIAFELEAFDVVTEVKGDATTDFGAPGKVPDIDRRPISADEAERQAKLVEAAWKYFDKVVAAAPKSLRKGPRGGGRDTAKIVEHVTGADESYARKVGLTSATYSRKAVLEALAKPGPAAKDAKSWPTRYMARRMAWHILDHAWEIEDRSEG